MKVAKLRKNPKEARNQDKREQKRSKKQKQTQEAEVKILLKIIKPGERARGGGGRER